MGYVILIPNISCDVEEREDFRNNSDDLATCDIGSVIGKVNESVVCKANGNVIGEANESVVCKANVIGEANGSVLYKANESVFYEANESVLYEVNESVVYEANESVVCKVTENAHNDEDRNLCWVFGEKENGLLGTLRAIHSVVQATAESLSL